VSGTPVICDYLVSGTPVTGDYPVSRTPVIFLKWSKTLTCPYPGHWQTMTIRYPGHRQTTTIRYPDTGKLQLSGTPVICDYPVSRTLDSRRLSWSIFSVIIIIIKFCWLFGVQDTGKLRLSGIRDTGKLQPSGIQDTGNLWLSGI